MLVFQKALEALKGPRHGLRSKFYFCNVFVWNGLLDCAFWMLDQNCNVRKEVKLQARYRG